MLATALGVVLILTACLVVGAGCAYLALIADGLIDSRD